LDRAIKKRFPKVLDNPGKHGRENVNDNNGRFFEDYCNWERIEEFKDCIFNSAGAQIVAEATNSKSAQIFHEHIFIKEPGHIKKHLGIKICLIIVLMVMIQEVFGYH
jgi:hypothetical protein